MQNLWTWGGEYFGYRENNCLWTHDGRHVGLFQGDEIYGPNGRYLGEVLSDRLITNCGKKSWRASCFTPYGNRVGIVKYVNYVGNVMYAGHEDFPSAEGLG